LLKNKGHFDKKQGIFHQKVPYISPKTKGGLDKNHWSFYPNSKEEFAKS
jgi:hypothetical protein